MTMRATLHQDPRVWTDGPVKPFMIPLVIRSRVRVIIIRVRISSIIMTRDGIMMIMMSTIKIHIITIKEEDTDRIITEVTETQETEMGLCQVRRFFVHNLQYFQLVHSGSRMTRKDRYYQNYRGQRSQSANPSYRKVF